MEEYKTLEKRMTELEKRVEKLEKSNTGSKTKTVTDLDEIDHIKGLMKEGFFDEPKKYGEIIKRLKTTASFSKKGKYLDALKQLVRDKKLERKQVHHQWKYQKNE